MSGFHTDRSKAVVLMWSLLPVLVSKFHDVVVVQLSLVVRKPVFGVLTWSDTNRAVQPKKMARGVKFRIKNEEVLYYPCSKNKGADQLSCFREADLRLCFRICKKPVFSRRGSIYVLCRVFISHY